MVLMYDSDDDQTSLREATSNNSPRRSLRRTLRNSADDTDGEPNDGYGEIHSDAERSAYYPSRLVRKSSDNLDSDGELDEDDEVHKTPTTPFKERLYRQMPFTPRNEHQHPYQQKRQGYHRNEDDAVAHGIKRSTKDGSVYLQKMQQKDPTFPLPTTLNFDH
ncbi:hypothetical protein BGZ47_002942 [Haplosporangium gracile]|nr:hypothetical protein BGZ47_002942 [Haplosporangium gracile]